MSPHTTDAFQQRRPHKSDVCRRVFNFEIPAVGWAMKMIQGDPTFTPESRKFTIPDCQRFDIRAVLNFELWYQDELPPCGPPLRLSRPRSSAQSSFFDRNGNGFE